MATSVDDVVAGQLNSSLAAVVQFAAAGHVHAGERLRASFDQNSHALNALIGIKLVQASDPGTDSDFNAAVRTPYGMGPSGETVPSTATVTK